MGGIAGGGLSLGTLFINIAADVEDATRAIEKFGRDTAGEIDKQKEKWDGLATVGQSMTQLGGALTAGLTLPIVGIGAAAVTAAGEFEASMNKITAVSGTTGTELESLRALAMQLGADTKFSAQEAAEGMGNLAAAGLSTNEILAASAGVLDLAAAGQLSVARAAEVTTDTMGQFGLAAGEAGRIADVFAKGAGASSISVAQLAESMKLVGPVARLAGISLEETTAIVSLLAKEGIKGSEAGTGLRGVIASLLSPSKKAQESLDALGVSTKDAAGNMLPLHNIMGQLKTSGADASDMFRIFGREQASVAAALTNESGPAWKAMTEEVGKSQGAAKLMADTLNTGLKGAFEQMKGSLDTVLIALGQSLLPILTTLVQKGTEFVNNWILPAVTAFGQLNPTLQTAILAVAALLAAIGPIILAAGAFVSAFAALAPILTVVGGALATFVGALSAPVLAIAAVTAALIALGVWVYANWDSIVSVLTLAWDTIQSAWESVWSTITGALTALWNGYIAGMSAIWGPVITFFVGLWDTIKSAWESIWGTIGGALTAVWNAYIAVMNAIWGPVINFFIALWDTIKAKWVGIWEDIKNTLVGIWNTISGAATTAWNAITGAWNQGKKAAEDLKTATGGATDATKDHGKEAGKAAPKIEAVATAIKSHGGAAKTATPKIKKQTEAAKDQKEEVIKLHKATHDFIEPTKTLAESLHTLYTKTEPATKELFRLREEAGKATEKMLALKEPVASLSDYAKTNLTPTMTAAGEAIAGLGTKATTIAAPGAITLRGALNELGLKSASVYTQMATDAQTAYDKVIASGQASQWEKDSAFIKLLEAQRAAMVVNGQQIPADFQKMLDDLNAKTADPSKGLPKTTSLFEGFGTQVSTVITNFAQDISKSLWEGDMSWGEKGLALLKSLGQAVTSAFIEPFAKAIGDLIAGAIADLLGGKGLGGIMEGLKGIGTAAGGVFGGAAGAAGGIGAEAAGGAAGAAGGAGGVGAAAGGAAGMGMSAIVGMVTGAITAISSVISNFQFAAMNKSLDLIVNHTLRIYNDLANFRTDAWDRWTQFMVIKDDILTRMNTLVDNSNLASLQLNDIITASNRIAAATELMSAGGARTINITVNGSDPAAVGSYLATHLRLQGALG